MGNTKKRLTKEDIRKEFFHEYKETNCRVQDKEGNFPEVYEFCTFIGTPEDLLERFDQYANQRAVKSLLMIKKKVNDGVKIGDAWETIFNFIHDEINNEIKQLNQNNK